MKKPKKAIILQKRRQEKPLGTQGLSANHNLRLAQGWQLGSRFMIVSHGPIRGVLHEDFSNASLILDVRMNKSVKLRVEVGHKNKRTTTTSSSLVVPLHQSLFITAATCLPSLFAASDPLLQLGTTAASCTVTDIVPDPISFSFKLLWLCSFPKHMPK